MIGIDLSGQQFHYLTAIKPVGSSSSGVVWECECKCGSVLNVPSKSLRTGNTKSCGCFKREVTVARNETNATHGMTGTPEWITWDSMIQRCTNDKHKSYSVYGGAGIKVCKKWLNSFEAFYKDMGPRPAGKTLDRIDNNKGYKPGNCRWATAKEQANNRHNNVKLTANGVTDTVANWARKTGIGPKTIAYRIKNGWSVEQALTVTPLKTNKLEKL